MSFFSWMRSPQAGTIVEIEPEVNGDGDFDEQLELPEEEPVKTYKDGEWWHVTVTMLGGGDQKHIYSFNFGKDEPYEGMKDEAVELARSILPAYTQSGLWTSDDQTVRINRVHVVSVKVHEMNAQDKYYA